MISIAIPYYNRKQVFIETLKSISRSTYKDFEVVVVDDASDPKERIEGLREKFPFLKVIRVEKKDKWYVSSCMPWNRAIANSSGDIILMQNPECYHVHDVLSHVMEMVDDSNYVSMSTYSINEDLTKEFPSLIKKEFLKSLPQQPVKDYIGWYNHSVYNPTYYPFCAAITRKNMEKLGGFDERFADGFGFEDVDFINRIGRLGLTKIISDDVSVIHQRHLKVWDLYIPEQHALWTINENLYRQIKTETICKVNNRYE